jgi:uncharacterized YccA/Bax inhibitor family protein
MQLKSASRSFLPLTIIFVIAGSLFLTGRSLFARWNIDTDVLIVGNIILFFATIISFLLYYRSYRTKNGFAILRMVYAGLFVKLLICAISAVIYIMNAGEHVNKGGIFGCLFLYVIYSAAEVTILMKLSKQYRNA